ncbi:flavodoxin-dependent (E)-4-hydroxy-3-methylbut-2-enyl-diphosphate synthase [candidate division TA06 bacterium]|uniref:4-hydroxy-3-methylbut-2-en-1-yl diphosphate synthase (flavodoxin) n=1 Tax=candidate division TA06 bacterium TaxID=2250710 RepID=A0A933MKZ0_UNCT6|nr:flavodoxin-dependent (E)-4-hydroxy-3-methylbut-2-enyl-diphosphate synthase [candidate division TA06 bacterium]
MSKNINDPTSPRAKTKTVKIGGFYIGGENPVSIQSMTNTDTADPKATLAQIKKLENAGCQIVRLAVPDQAAARALKLIRQGTKMPLVADIHFDHRLALMALEAGVDKLRINPGNIGSQDKIKQVVRAAAQRGVPIRIGVNAGSLEKDILARHGRLTALGLVESALRHVRILEDLGFTDIVISLKGSEVPMTIEAYRIMSRRSKYPLHLGITEAGTAYAGAIRSAVGIGSLLAQGIGDTVRVSLSGDPVKEVEAARIILQSLDLGSFGPVVLACPTCGRAKIDVERIASQVEKRIRNIKAPLKIAVMGCAVNGPGEARQADIGIAGGHRGRGLLFKKGKAVEMVDEKMMVVRLLAEINKMSQK